MFFANDYNCGCHPKILEKLQEINFKHLSGYGCDEYTDSVRKKVLSAFGLEKGDVFFAMGGTQANMLVISAYLRPYEGVICAATGHVETHEAGAIEGAGHKVLTLPGYTDKIPALALERYLDNLVHDESYDHMVHPGMVYISFPTELGRLYTKKELLDIRKVCDEYHIPLFIDGARLGYGLMSEGCDVSAKELAEIADVFYIGGTKVGALFGEAIVAKKLPLGFFTVAKQKGAVLAKGFVAAAQFDALFTEDLYFQISKHANQMAMKLKAAILEKGYRPYLESKTNQQFVIVSHEKAEEISKHTTFATREVLDDEIRVIRFCTSWATTEEEVDELISIL